jgi:hypothetical protein
LRNKTPTGKAGEEAGMDVRKGRRGAAAWRGLMAVVIVVALGMFGYGLSLGARIVTHLASFNQQLADLSQLKSQLQQMNGKLDALPRSAKGTEEMRSLLHEMNGKLSILTEARDQMKQMNEQLTQTNAKLDQMNARLTQVAARAK